MANKSTEKTIYRGIPIMKQAAQWMMKVSNKGGAIQNSTHFFTKIRVIKIKLLFNELLCNVRPAFLTLIFLLWAVIASNAQTNKALRSGITPGSIALSEFESINPYSGNLNFDLPIIVAEGRGLNNSPISVNINTKLAIKTYYEGNGETFNFVDKSFHPFGSNENFILPVKAIGQYENGGSRVYCPGDNTPRGFEISTSKINISINGTQYDLVDRKTHGKPFKSYCNDTGFNRGNVFETTDGTSAVFTSDYTIIDAPYYFETPDSSRFPVRGNLMTSDGTSYRIEGVVIWSKDKNGNKITYSYSNLDGGDSYLSKITDSLNREIIFEPFVQDIAPYGECYRITYKGFGGDNKVIRISYNFLRNLLRPGDSLQFAKDLFPPSTYDIYSPPPPPPYPPRPCAPLCTGEYLFDLDRMISAVWLPNGTSYKFQYNHLGELARVEIPTGAAVEYDWSENTGNGYLDGGIQGFIYRRVTERRTYGNGVDLDSKLRLSGLESLGSRTGQVFEDHYGNNNNLINRTKHYYYGILSNYEATHTGYWQNGLEYQTDVFNSDGSTLLRSSTKTWQQTPFNWYTGNPYSAPSNNPHVAETTSLLADSNQVSKQTFSYDNFNNLTDTYEYDYGIGAPGQFLRRSHTDYLTTNPVNNIDYTGDIVHILNLPSQTWVSSDTAGNGKVSLMQYEYDNYTNDQNHAPLLDRTNISGHDSTFGTNYTARGNPTKITSYENAQNQTGAVSAYRQYDIAGNQVKGIDAKGYATTIDYADRFGTPDAEARNNVAPSQLNGQQTYAFATSANGPAGYTTYNQFDYFTSRAVDSEDINGNVNTTYSVNDYLDRPTQTILANNRPQFRKQTTFIYDDTGRKVTVISDSKTFGDNLIKAESYYDKSGRTTETRQYETPTNYIATRQEYDSLGRAYKSSNPFRPYLNESPQFTTTIFDALGRVKNITTPDNAIVFRDYSGTTTTVTDQSLRKRSSTTDAIGRLLKVNEDPAGVNYETIYAYDVLGRVRKTTQTEGQITQNRYFMYNDLGGLIRAKQPEQIANSNLSTTDPITGNTNWSVAYNYDNNGNIASTTDANNRTTTGTYDDLNRLTFRDYSDSTPDTTFTFDNSTITNSKGQLTAVTTTVSSTLYTAFDELGRVKSSQQITNGQTYNMPNYTYDLSGALIAQTYPSLRVVTTETDSIGRLRQVLSQMPNQSQRTYASNLSYTSFGAVEKMKLGNGAWESAQFDNKRLQVKQIGLGASSNDTSYLKLEYDYGTTDNNGGLRQQKINFSGMSAQLVQNYGYDSLNRLQSATETTNGNSTPTWKQTFSYDRFGNRRFDGGNTTTLPANNGVYNPNINQTNNRLTVAEGYNYDNEGNLTTSPENQALFSYDAENHQTQVQNASGTTNYFYDGSGKRVRKVTGNQETVFVYDAFGKMVAEYTANQTITSDGTKYLTADAVGTPRAITDNSGHVVSRHDYMPFGEEVATGIGGRTDPQGYKYNSDGIKQQFTGYERDNESGLDYAQARYFSSKHGRFTSIDPLAASASIKNPQTFNRYSYALNSPYKFTDSLGLKSQCQGPGGGNNLTTLASCDGDGGDEDLPKRKGKKGAGEEEVVKEDSAKVEPNRLDGILPDGRHFSLVMQIMDSEAVEVTQKTVGVSTRTRDEGREAAAAFDALTAARDAYDIEHGHTSNSIGLGPFSFGMNFGTTTNNRSGILTGNPTFGFGFTFPSYSFSRTWAQGGSTPGLYGSGILCWSAMCGSGAVNPITPSASGFERGYGSPQLGAGILIIGPTMVFNGTTQYDWSRHPDNPNRRVTVTPVGRNPF